MTNQSIKVEDLREALKLAKGVQSSVREIASSLKGVYTDVTADLTFDDLMELKDSVHTFKTGDLVLCNWGGSRLGIITDPVVRYNGYMKFTKKNGEQASIVRLLISNNPLISESQNNMVVPYREISKVEEILSGTVIQIHNETEFTVRFHFNNKEHELKMHSLAGKDYSLAQKVELVRTKNKFGVNQFNIYQQWFEDTSKHLKLNGYGL